MLHQAAAAALICGLIVNIKAGSMSTEDYNKTIGGLNATQGELPYHISVRKNGYHHCSASLVVIRGQQVILTSADCLHFGTADDFTVVAGVLNIQEKTPYQQTRNVSTIIKHEKSTTSTKPYDIAILKIESPFELNDNVAPIPLPSRRQSTSGDVLISGWQITDGNYKRDNPILQKIQPPTLSSSSCKRAFGPVSRFMSHSPEWLCSGHFGRADPCRMDTGGPAVAVNGGYLAGIVSWSEGCLLLDGLPGGSTQVSHYIDWLERKVEGPRGAEPVTFTNLFSMLFRKWSISGR